MDVVWTVVVVADSLAASSAIPASFHGYRIDGARLVIAARLADRPVLQAQVLRRQTIVYVITTATAPSCALRRGAVAVAMNGRPRLRR